jgi:hypothetical protein
MAYGGRPPDGFPVEPDVVLEEEADDEYGHHEQYSLAPPRERLPAESKDLASLRWVAKRIDHAEKRARSTQRRSFSGIAVLGTVSVGSVTAGVIVDNLVFWAAAGAIFFMASSGLVLWAAKDSGVLADFLKFTHEHGIQPWLKEKQEEERQKLEIETRQQNEANRMMQQREEEKRQQDEANTLTPGLEEIFGEIDTP